MLVIHNIAVHFYVFCSTLKYKERVIIYSDIVHNQYISLKEESFLLELGNPHDHHDNTISIHEIAVRYNKFDWLKHKLVKPVKF